MITNKKGFTLIELMIVVAIIAIIAAIAIPGLLRARMSANEGAAIGVLRTISTSQQQFRNQSQVDQDIDGSGEYGFLGELAGTSVRRTGASVNPTFITPTLGPVIGSSTAQKSGYQFIMYLPGNVDDSILAAFQGVNAAGEQQQQFFSNDVINAQEAKYRCYAWPTSRGTTGTRAFAVSNNGEVLASSNETIQYTSDTTIPAFNAAIEAGTTTDAQEFPGIFKAGALAIDGQRWSSSAGS